MACIPILPFAGDPRTGRGDQVRKSGMIGEEHASLYQGVLDVENEEGVPAGGVAAVEHDLLGVVGG